MTARLLIAGSASGVGKTTVVVALTQALRKRGLKVVTFKCGPDYLDPTYHALASGAPCHNLDGWMMGRDAVTATFRRASAGADVALIEGVMGLFDGAAPDSEEGSAAEIAKWLDAPVIAVVDASGMARTIGAIALGLRDFDRDVKVAGIFANQVGSRGHLELLEKACPDVLGGLPARPQLAFPERHLGLRTADRSLDLEAWGALLEEWCSVEEILRVASHSTHEAEDTPRRDSRCRIGVAFDEAFHFYYEDNLRRLESLGAELVQFSPIRDAIPEVDGLYLGGGYPELHAEELTANTAMRESIRKFAGPIYAECGGLMYLSRAIRTLDGRDHEMVGLIEGVAVMRGKLEALGYVEVETQRRTILGGAGLRLRGHQFRYSTLEGAPLEDPAYRLRRRYGGETSPEGYGAANVLGSYVHVHWASNPLAAEGLIASCRAWR